MASATTADGYRVAPAQLTAAAGKVGEQAGALEQVASALAAETLGPQAFGQVPMSAEAARKHQRQVRDCGTRLSTETARMHKVATGLSTSATGYQQADAQVAGMFRALLPDAGVPRAGNAAAAGADRGAGPWHSEIAANRTRVASALEAERAHLAQLRAAHGEDKAIEQSEHRIALYQDILDHNRQILKFDPSGNGRMVELVGHLDANTRDVGLFVPGVHTTLGNFDSYAGLGRSIVAADPSGHTAMVVWADGEFPQNVTTQGASASYAKVMAPELASFSHDLRQQIAAQGGDGVAVTAVGHSYGGATVGLAETYHLDVDRVLHVESAGMGNGVWSPADLPPSQAGIQRYSMTAPLDPIVAAQGTTGHLDPHVGSFRPVGHVADSLTGYGHGADPDYFPGVTELETGRDAAGHLQWGLDAHSGVLKPGSDSWNNIYQVIHGGPVSPEGSVPPRGIGEHLIDAADREADARMRNYR